MFKVVWPGVRTLQCFSLGRCTTKSVNLMTFASFIIIFFGFIYFKRAVTPKSSIAVNTDILSCHGFVEAGLKPADYLKLNGRSIFFVESSCVGGLNSREACSVEAAARVNPDWNIVVMFAGPLRKQADKAIQTLLHYDNVLFARVNITTLSKNTPVENFVKNNGLQNSSFRIAHTADVLRWLILYKYGGLYLNMDTMAMRSFDSLPDNFAAKESPLHVACGIVAFSRENNLLKLLLRFLPLSYNPDVRSTIGPALLTRACQATCRTLKLEDMTAGKCQGFQIFEKDLFYPLWYANIWNLFKNEELILKKPVYTIHMWNHIIKEQHLSIYPHSAYARLANFLNQTLEYEFLQDDFGNMRQT